MGITAFKPGLVVVVLVLAPVCWASLCQFGSEYWSEEAGACVKCSRCEQAHAPVVLRPCQVHRDTVCGPLSALPIHWPWQAHAHTRQSVTHHRARSHAHEHDHPSKKHHHSHLPPLPHDDHWPVESLADVNQWEHWLQKRLQHKKEDLLKSLLREEKRNHLAHTFDADDDGLPSNEEDESTTTHRQHISELDLQMFEQLVAAERRQSEPSMQRVGAAEEPFSAAETLVWDWQAVALVSAVVACLLFFSLAAIYSLLHVRQWRRLKDDLHLDVEDLAVRVSLMNNGGLNNSNTDGGNTNHYLEQLLAVKKEGENTSRPTGNVYVEKQPKAS
ncbi:uncharacterized protein LOC111054411 isoform X2 [Nilaparvata lugens]|uniref:uncharacterized protein LOC111054411 isoform X2 n=1 Tax=Nilaparvata lugens TaxID=108931 RepID=UPI00193D00A9|nr:uncharacterized protein LOC111054411 isoform X2 [Nilaparvata lugens]